MQDRAVNRPTALGQQLKLDTQAQVGLLALIFDSNVAAASTILEPCHVAFAYNCKYKKLCASD